VKALSTINAILFIICIPVLLITTNVRFAVNDMRLYEYGFNKYHVSEDAGLNKGNLTEIAHELITYFNSNEEFADISAYNQRDITHLKDVKGLIQLVYRLQFVSLAYIIVYILFNLLVLRGAFWRDLARRLIWGSWTTVALLAALGLAAVVDFDQFFLLFHLVSFRNDFWQLYPGDKLLLMFPENFFRDAALFIAGAAIVEAIIIGAAAWYFLKRRGRVKPEPVPPQSNEDMQDS
jgi:integral membrane protein (TIGR01906 family)